MQSLITENQIGLQTEDTDIRIQTLSDPGFKNPRQSTLSRRQCPVRKKGDHSD
ncbi:hypothetical protein HQ585_19685 [candidate division KSB1 bacterium]|nr:hypothetical protein [candidate division KSB1 bacterium]